MQKQAATKWSLLLLPIVLLALLVWAVGFIIVTPTLKVTAKQNEIDIDVRTMGEYPTTVKRLTISSQEDGTVLDLRASTPTQIGRLIVLHCGHNDLKQIVVYRGLLEPGIPAGGDEFTLRRGVRYRVRVWFKHWSSEKSFAF